MDSYIAKIQSLGDNFHEILRKAIEDKEGFILGMIKNRLYQQGLDGDLKKIGDYADSTIVRKKEKRQRSSHITLRDTGAFYNGMYVRYEGNRIVTGSTNWKQDILETQYGKAILSLTDQEKEIILDTIVDKALQDYADSAGQIISAGSFE